MAKVQHPPAGYRLVQNPDYVIQEGDLWWSTKSQNWYSCVSFPGRTLRMARLDFVASNQKQQTCTHDLASLSEMLESLDDDLLYDVVHMACFEAAQRARAAADEIDMRLTGYGYEGSLNTSCPIPALSNRLFNNTASGVLDIKIALDVFRTRFSEPEE